MTEEYQKTEYIGFRYGSGEKISLHSEHDHLGDNLIYGPFSPSKSTDHIGFTVTLRTTSRGIRRPVPDERLIRKVTATIRQVFADGEIDLLREPASSWDYGPVPKGLHQGVVQLTRITFRLPTEHNDKAMGIARGLHRKFLDGGIESAIDSCISAEAIHQLVNAASAEILTSRLPFSNHLDAIERYFDGIAALPNSRFRCFSTITRTANHAAYATSLGTFDFTPQEGKLLVGEFDAKESISFFSSKDVTASLISATVRFVERRAAHVKQFIRPTM